MKFVRLAPITLPLALAACSFHASPEPEEIASSKGVVAPVVDPVEPMPVATDSDKQLIDLVGRISMLVDSYYRQPPPAPEPSGKEVVEETESVPVVALPEEEAPESE